MSLGSILIKGSDSKNVAVSAFFGKLRMMTVPSMRSLTATAENFAKTDSIADFAAFEKEIAPFVHTKASIQAAYYGSESYKYGYYNEILKYSGISFNKFSLLPGLEHGVRFGSAPWRFDGRNLVYACQSDNRISEIHDVDPLMPVFSLGPYINYAGQYYSDEKLRELKEKLGKTLLVVPSHSHEGNLLRTSGQNCVGDIYEKYGYDFDTVMVCVYWNDVFEPEIAEFKERGAMIVSAGFREDAGFVRRLKTIISLADYAVGNDIGTNMGYCMALGKQFSLIHSANKVPEDDYYTSVYESFAKAFTPCDGVYGFTREQKELQAVLCRRWWGIGESEKTPEEIKAILTTVIKISKECRNNTDKRAYAVKSLLASDKLSEAERKCLTAAVSIR